MNALLALLLISKAAFAGSAADTLMGAVAKPADPAHPAAPLVEWDTREIRLADPFLAQFFGSIQSARALPPEAVAWARKLLMQDFAGSAALWSKVRPLLPPELRDTGEAAYLYQLWKLDLPSRFLSRWTQALSNPSFAESRAGLALEQTVAPGFDRWLEERAPLPTADEERVIASLPPQRSTVFATLHAWVALRSAGAGPELLSLLPSTHALKRPLALTVTLAAIRRGDLPAAASLLKSHVEPAIEAARSPELLARHYIEVARLLYQAGYLNESELYYSKVPSGASSYLEARQELTWVWLRKGELSRLRGELKSLSQDVIAKKFSPETYVVRAISDLKLCYYDQVERDFAGFRDRNRPWARKIDEALKADDAPAPREPDFYSLWAARSVGQAQRESARIDALGTAAAWPEHWMAEKKEVASALEQARGAERREYRRQWTDDSHALAEAMRKMRFVRVEYGTQVRTVEAMPAADEDSIRLSSAAATRVLEEKASIASGGRQVYRFDGTYWPDELFHLRAAGLGKCKGQPGGSS